MTAILIGTFVGTLGNSLTNVAVPSIMAEFEIPLSSAVWVVTIFVLILAVLMPVGGYLGDLYGQRRVYLWGMGLFTLAAVATGLAPTFASLLGARALLGIGIAPTLPSVMAIIAFTFSPGERGRAMGFWALANASAHALGPPLSGFLIDHLGWRVAFLSSVPLCLVNIAAVWWLVPADTRRERRPFDFAGAAALTASATGLMLALTQSARWGWDAPQSLALWAGTLFALGSFIAVERRAAVPFVELGLFRNRQYTAAMVVIAAQNFALFGLLLALPIYLIEVQGRSSQLAGLLVLPLPLIMSVVAPFAGRLADAWGSRRTCTLGMAIVVLGGLGLLAMQPARGALPWYGLAAGLLVVGAGMGLTQSPVTLAVTGIVPQAQMGVATGIFHMGRFVSGSLGTTVFGLILAMEAAGMATGFQHNLLAVVIAAGVAVIATRLLPGRLAATGSQATA
ncbi:MAG TPA: DHA2 family efflux MFS transporter permease subunit [Anaerolineae bacterium]|nr:DHA2 family efflux MFS transporter permease subunit [Anaerolineae bacterium]